MIASQPHQRPLRVLVVDDHALFRIGLCEILGDEGFDVAGADSGEAALRRVTGFSPDVVIMDVHMPVMCGIEATRRLRQVAPASGVLMLSMAESDDEVLHALRAGASGYLLKDAHLDEITAGIRAVASGYCPLSPQVARTLVDGIRRGSGRDVALARPRLDALSERERQVLALLADGCDNAEIGRRLFVSPSTVKHHVSRLFERLGVDNRVQAATYAIRHGVSAETPSQPERRRAAA